MDNAVRPQSLLDSIRQEIDEIDRQLAELLDARFAASEQVKQAKLASDGEREVMPYRPGREAVVLRQAVEAAGDRVGGRVAVRIWRTILSASTLMQAEVSIVAARELLDKAEAQAALMDFAALIPVERAAGVGDAVEALDPEKPLLAAVPLKSGWLKAVQESGGTPARVAQIVMVKPDRPASAIAIVGHARSEATGGDETLVSTTGKLPRDFVPKPLWTLKLDEDLHVTALPGYLSPNEQPLVGLKSTPGLALKVVGRYPAPFDAEF